MSLKARVAVLVHHGFTKGQLCHIPFTAPDLSPGPVPIDDPCLSVHNELPFATGVYRAGVDLEDPSGREEELAGIAAEIQGL